MPSDRQYMRIVSEVRSGLGRDIDFSDIEDRKTIGRALIDYLRKRDDKDEDKNDDDEDDD